MRLKPLFKPNWRPCSDSSRVTASYILSFCCYYYYSIPFYIVIAAKKHANLNDSGTGQQGAKVPSNCTNLLVTIVKLTTKT